LRVTDYQPTVGLPIHDAHKFLRVSFRTGKIRRMARPQIGENRMIGADYVAQYAHLSHLSCRGFNDGHFRVGRTVQQRQGYTYLAVKATGRTINIFSFAQDVRDGILGNRLPATPYDGDHGGLQAGTPPLCQPVQGDQRIIDFYGPPGESRSARLTRCYYDRDRAVFQRFTSEPMPVRVSARKGEENALTHYLTRMYRDVAYYLLVTARVTEGAFDDTRQVSNA
jgi:hypothetical protein